MYLSFRPLLYQEISVYISINNSLINIETFQNSNDTSISTRIHKSVYAIENIMIENASDVKRRTEILVSHEGDAKRINTSKVTNFIIIPSDALLRKAFSFQAIKTRIEIVTS